MPVRDTINDKTGAGRPDKRPDQAAGKGSAERFKAAMPRIPGVSEQPPKLIPAQPDEWSNESRSDENDGQDRFLSARQLIMVGLAICFAGVLGWWSLHAKRVPAKAVDSADPAVDAPPAISDDAAGGPAQDAGPGDTAVATLGELGKPWASKKFTFVDPQTHERVPAMVVRLPGTNAASKDAYWAFSLNAPYKTCQLDYLDPADILARYAFRASHPMVAAGCDATLYDPLRVGTTPDGAWVRGDIAQGPGIRPPISIEIRVQGGRIVADRIE